MGSDLAALEQLCSELNLALIVTRDPFHGWHASIKSYMQPHALVTGQAPKDGSMQDAVDHLLTRAFRVISDFRPRIEAYNAREQKKQRNEMRRMGLK